VPTTLEKIKKAGVDLPAKAKRRRDSAKHFEQNQSLLTRKRNCSKIKTWK
jgi:hypothetical protein